MRTFASKVGENAHKITKLIILIKRGLKVFTNMVGCEKARAHGGGSSWER
jgi:hypothetical protein